jgi:hypothetical protein
MQREKLQNDLQQLRSRMELAQQNHQKASDELQVGFPFVFIRCSTHIPLLAITLPTKINEDDIDLLSFNRFETEMASIFRYR